MYLEILNGCLNHVKASTKVDHPLVSEKSLLYHRKPKFLHELCIFNFTNDGLIQ